MMAIEDFVLPYLHSALLDHFRRNHGFAFQGA